MKHLLFVLTNFRHGGTNKSLENLLSLINTEMYQIDVFAMEHFGPYKQMLKSCTILPEDKWLNALIANYKDTKGVARQRSFVVKILRIICFKFKFNLTEFIYKKASKSILKGNNYDAVIAYSEGVPTAFVTHLKHPNSIAWIHCDYSSYLKLNNQPDETEIYKKYQSIVCVSEYTKKEFCRIIPEIKDNVYAIHNMANAVNIKKLAKEQISDSRFLCNNFTILSIGRIDVVKRFDKIPEVVSKLKERRINFIWYLIGPVGFGQAQVQFDENVRKYKVEDNFVWLGAKDNPYPYMANSNLLVMTSKSEACPYVLNEAKIIGLPIITTNYGSAIEFIDNGLDGIITPIENMVDEIEKIILDKELYNTIKQNLQTYRYENKAILDKFYSLIG